MLDAHHHTPAGKLEAGGVGVGFDSEPGTANATTNTNACGTARDARRCASGIARCAGIPSNSPGDLCLALSTRNHEALDAMDTPVTVQFMPDFLLNPVFEATVACVEETIVNSMVGNLSMTGINGFTVQGLPTQALLLRFGKLVET